MAFTTPLLGEAKDADNTGTYSGYEIWVKGDGRVQCTKGDETYIFNNVANAKFWIDAKEGGPPPDEGTVSVSSIDPTSTPIDTPVQITITGTGFTEASTVQVDGNDVVSAFVSDTSLTADLPSAATPGTVQVTVTEAGNVSNAVDFEVTAA